MSWSKTTTLWTAAIGVPVLVMTSVWAVTTFADDDGRDQATVVRVIDGDTIDVDLAGEETRVRLLNIDTPETKHPDEPVQCLGPEATDFLESLLPVGAEVELEYDIEREDRYGRTLAGVFRADSLVNAEIAAAGLGIAVVYEPNRKFYDEVKAAESQAEDRGDGLFDPSVECSVPAQLDQLEDAVDEVLGAIPDDLAGVEAALLAVPTVSASLQQLGNVLRRIDSDGDAYTVPARVFAAQLSDFRGRVSTMESDLDAHRAALTEQKEEIEAEIKAEEERKKAEEERKKAEEEEAERQRIAAEEAERQRIAEQEAAAAAAERERQAAAAEAERRRSQQSNSSSGSTGGSGGSRSPGSSGGSSSSGYGTDADFPGYTGPRCYAPGGQMWRPCG